jgi:hypothetical protein
VAASAVTVVAVESAGSADVYDLTVDDAHEFFANGVLVHNCMAAKRYVYMFRYHTRLKRVEAGSLVPAKSMLGVGRGNRRDQAKRF